MKKSALFCLFMIATSSVMAQKQIQRVDTQALKAELKQVVSDEIASSANQQGWDISQITLEVRLPSATQKLPACNTPLVISQRDHKSLPIGNLKRAIECQNLTQSWKVNVSVKSTITVEVLTAKTNINRDQIINASMLSQQAVTLSRDIAFFTQASDVIERRAARRIRQGQVFAPSHLQPDWLIEKDEQVVITANKGAFSATMAGIALENGELSEQIRIKNQSSGKVIKARVIDKGIVETLF